MPALQKGEAVEVSAETQLISVEMSCGPESWVMVDSGWKGMLVENAGWIGFRSNLRSVMI